MHGDEFEKSDQARHDIPARFTWRSRFLEARDQESLWFVSYVSKKEGKEAGEEGRSVIQKEQDDIRASVFRRQHLTLPCSDGHTAN